MDTGESLATRQSYFSFFISTSSSVNAPPNRVLHNRNKVLVEDMMKELLFLLCCILPRTRKRVTAHVVLDHEIVFAQEHHVARSRPHSTLQRLLGCVYTYVYVYVNV